MEGCGSWISIKPLNWFEHALVLALMVSAPMLIIGLVVGIVVSLFQAVTQIQEQTLTFIPKIAAMVAAAILLMPWIGQRCWSTHRRYSCRFISFRFVWPATLVAVTASAG